MNSQLGSPNFRQCVVREDRHGQGSNDFGPYMEIGEEISDLWVKNEELKSKVDLTVAVMVLLPTCFLQVDPRVVDILKFCFFLAKLYSDRKISIHLYTHTHIHIYISRTYSKRIQNIK